MSTLVQQSPPQPLTLKTDSLPNATTSQAFKFSFTAQGGTAPYRWSLSSSVGNLPAGLSLSESGIISGVPTQSGDFPIDITVRDSALPANTVSRKFVIKVILKSDPLNITTSSLPDATAGREYATLLTALGGQPPYNWQLAPGSQPLPSGLFVARGGVVAGVPSETGDFPISIEVSDSTLPAPLTAAKQLILNAAVTTLTVSTISLESGTVSVLYTANLTAAGGLPPYTWQLSPESNPLPSGLSLDSSGAISGTPSLAGPLVLTVQVTDSHQVTAVAGVNLYIESAVGTKYYVDADGGDDGNYGTSVGTAWKTLARINNAEFLPGDQILLKRGGVWHEMLEVPSSGEAQNPIHFGAYGDGKSPVIDAADVVSGWSNYTGSVYNSQIDWSPLHIWEDGILLAPASGVRGITSPGRWFYDSAAGLLYVWGAQNDSPANHVIEADRRRRAIDVVSKSYVTVSDVTLINSMSYLVGIYDSPNVTLLNCQLRNSAGAAVDVGAASPNFLIDHSNYSVDPGYTGSEFVSIHSTQTDSPVVSNNTVADFGGDIAISVTDILNAQIYGNTIVGNGEAIGAKANNRNVTDAQVHHNFIAACSEAEGDGECIEFTGHKSPVYSVTGRIHHNIVLGGPNTFGGIDGWHSVDSTIYGNIVMNTNHYGMQWTAGCTGNLFYNNTIVNALVAGIAIYTNSSAQIVNSIISKTHVGISTEGTSTVIEDYNLIDSNSIPRSTMIAPGPHTILGDPFFVGTSIRDSGNVRLQAGSPAIRSGENLGTPFNLIFDSQSGSWPYAMVDQNATNSGWERGAIAFR